MILSDLSDLKNRIKTESERHKNDELDSVEKLNDYTELLVEYECALRGQLCKVQKEIELIEQQIQSKTENETL